MARYLLDTGILVGYLRAAPFAAYIQKYLSPFDPPNIPAISIVTVGELLSFAYSHNWGKARQDELQCLLRKVPRVDINNASIFESYAEIDAFSQGKHPTRPLSAGLSSRNMGKNDLWIAATASVVNAKLITTDKDFQHLDSEFLTVIYVDPASHA